jgi:hypothetical protein
MAKKSKAEIAANSRAAVKAGMSEPKKLVSYKQAKIIGRSVGGMKALGKTPKKGLSFQKVLRDKGLTFAKANAIINAMKKARVLNEHMGMTTTAAQKKKAKTILDQHM